jgi:hypothetical protein
VTITPELLVGWGCICASWKGLKIIYHFCILHFPWFRNSLSQQSFARLSLVENRIWINVLLSPWFILVFWFCDRTTSEMRGLSLKIISGYSRWSENAQTHTHKHIVPNMKFKLKILQIKCHVLGCTKDKAQNVLQKIIRVFAEAFVSHDRYTHFALEESGPPRTTYTCESQ